MNAPGVQAASGRVSVIGMAGRFAQRQGVRGLWSAFSSGEPPPTSAVGDRFQSLGVADPRRSARYTDDAVLLADVVGFDWRAFRTSPKEAARLDPQQRILLEEVREALDSAGLSEAAIRGANAGVFVGAMWDDFLRLHEGVPTAIDGYTLSGATRAFLANRISFTYDLRGPSVTVDAACTSSLVALHEARRALLLGECDLAIAAGVNLVLAPDAVQMMCASQMLARDGEGRPYHEAGDGFVRAEGCGVVVLRRSAEVTPRDRVFAELLGSATCHNGRTGWIMEPSAEGQSRTIREAVRSAGVPGARLRYVETHGTGFRQGDSIEVAAVAEAAQALGAGSCWFGTGKGQLGHAEGASGIGSFMRACLAFHHGVIPPTRRPERPLSALDSHGERVRCVFSPLALDELGADAVAAVSATSYGGSNASVVVGRAPARREGAAPPPALLLLVSAVDDEGLRDAISDLRAWFATDCSATDVCFTQAACRADQVVRAAFIARDAGGLVELLGEALAPGQVSVDAAVASRAGELSAIANDYVAGRSRPWSEGLPGRVCDLPPRRWKREPLWPPAFSRDDPGPGGTAVNITESTRQERGTLLPRLRSTAEGHRKRLLQREICHAVAAILGLDYGAVGAHDGFFDIGMSSVSMVELRLWLESSLDRRFEVSDLISCANAVELSARALEDLAADRESSNVDQARQAETSEALGGPGDAQVEESLIARLEQLGF